MGIGSIPKRKDLNLAPIDSFLCDVTHQPVPFEHCIGCAESGKARKVMNCYHAADVLRGIASMIRKPMDILSVTELQECPRALWFKKKNPYQMKPSKGYWMHRGHGFHKMMEFGSLEGDIRELRMYAEINGHKVSGQPDIIRGTVIDDYKTTKSVPGEPKEDHRIQVSCYRLIAHLQNPPIEIDENAFITYMSMGEHKRLPMKLWDLETTKKWMGEELAKRYALLASDEPPNFEDHFSTKHWKCGYDEAHSYCEVRRACTNMQMIPEAEPRRRKVKESSA